VLRPRASRRPAVLVPLALAATLTAACGEQTTVISNAEPRTEAFEVSGEVGSAPEVTWSSRMTADDPETEVVVEGDGAALKEGEQVLVNYYVGNGFTRDTAFETYAEAQVPSLFPVGGEVPQPASAEPNPEAVARYLLDVFVSEQVEAGDTVGTRKVVTAGSADIVGAAGAALDIGNEDALAIVIDITGTVKDGPDGEPVKARPAWVPAVRFADGAPASLDFTGTPEPDGTLKKAILYPGEGPELAADDLIVVDYLGAVYDAEEPFDASYDGEPFPTVLGQGAVIKGWDDALVGVPVGSRVMLQVPPRLGYGKEGSGENIPGDSTLYFLIDVLAAG
jgi:peptidylprolyl isomerase